MELQNTAVIITGAASGLGAATARWLSRQGARIALFDVNVDAANKIAAEIKGQAFHCNVSDADSVENAVLEAQKLFGQLRVCVNCAGIVHSRRMVNKQGMMPLDEFRHVIDVNLIGTFNVMRVVSNHMIALNPEGKTAERGVIINTASIAAYEGQIGQLAYSASKGGVVSLTLPAARELAQFGIRVLAIAPGLVDTPMFDKLSPEAKASLNAAVPFPKRLANPDEFAMLVQHMIENPMLNGEVIRLDGGLRLS
jgi:NAD(P)-dependent dehydrogenase (short-subunit alcohol dehydrogenase family)